jgi:hypothetical protein
MYVNTRVWRGQRRRCGARQTFRKQKGTLSLRWAAESGYAALMADYHCQLCDRTEKRCECYKYCCMCYGEYKVRMGEDGLYYCEACREACEIRLPDEEHK